MANHSSGGRYIVKKNFPLLDFNSPLYVEVNTVISFVYTFPEIF